MRIDNFPARVKQSYLEGRDKPYRDRDRYRDRNRNQHQIAHQRALCFFPKRTTIIFIHVPGRCLDDFELGFGFKSDSDPDGDSDSDCDGLGMPSAEDRCDWPGIITPAA